MYLYIYIEREREYPKYYAEVVTVQVVIAKSEQNT